MRFFPSGPHPNPDMNFAEKVDYAIASRSYYFTEL